MRVLSDNPNTEFLRREAKDVLGSLRETDDKVTLADAQRMLAEMYGFRTWSDLKAEVDRRRGAAPEAPDGLAEDISVAFGLGPPTAPMTPIRYEYMGRRWCLETAMGRFVIVPVFNWINDEHAGTAVDLKERARGAGVASPVSVRTPDGGLVRRLLDQSWRVEEWMDLGPAPVEPVSSSVARHVGQVLAAIHEVAPSSDRPIQGPWVADRPSEASWAAVLNQARTAKKPWADEFAALSRTVAELSAICDGTPTDSVIITNRDITVDTVRIGAAGDLVVMHWDFAGPMTVEWELASVLLQWSVYSGNNLEAARALVDGYRARAGSVPRLTLGSFTSAISGWLNWALQRAHGSIAPESPEQADFEERAVRETLAAPLTVAALSSLLEALEPVSS